MNRNTIILFLFTCLFITACSDNDEPKDTDAIIPITFGKRDYAVMFGKGAVIPFTDGGGVYELTASNPEVLGKFWIDMETNNQLYIQPAKVGDSYLTIKDVKAEAIVTLHVIVEDFYLPFVIDKIEGNNQNMFFVVGAAIKFIRNGDNTKPVKIEYSRPMTFKVETIAEGHFNITRSDTNKFVMDFSLHHSNGEDSKLYDYEYILGGDGEYMTMFDHIFDFGLEKNIFSSKSQPVRRIEMTLTDKSNGCKITCSLQQ